MLYLFVLEPISKVISCVGKIDCAVILPANVPAPPTFTSNATPKPPLDTKAPEPILVEGAVLFVVIDPDDKIFPVTSSASLGLVVLIPTCCCELILITVDTEPPLFNLKSISSSCVPN